MFLRAMIAALLIVVCSHVNIYQQTKEQVLWITHSTVDFIIGTEGFRQTAYKDIRGLWTTGVGHLIKASERHLIHTELDREQVMLMLHADLTFCGQTVLGYVLVPINQNQYDALMSLCFNIGADNFRQSTVLKRLNTGDYMGAADAFMMWVKPEVLKQRRIKERTLFLSPVEGEKT